MKVTTSRRRRRKAQRAQQKQHSKDGAIMTMISATGRSGVISFDGSMITLDRTKKGRGIFGATIKHIPLHHVSAVQFRRASRFGTAGYLQLSLGGNDVKTISVGQVMAAAKDENSVLFGRKQEDDFVRVYGAIHTALMAQVKRHD